MATDLDTLIDERVLARMKKRRWVGLALGIQHHDDVSTRCYGYADIENQVAVHKDTVFAIGSLTKQFTAVLILRLAELEKLSIDDEVIRYLPDCPGQDHRITIHHLLTHTSGIQEYTTAEFRRRFHEDLSPDEVAATFKDEPFRSEPGERFEYSNSGYHLLGMIAEAVVGKPYSQCIEQYLFEPLGLEHTRYFANAPIIPNRASGYVIENGVVHNSPYLSWHIPYSGGAIGSTAADMLKWQRSLNRHTILAESSLRLMRTPGTVASGESTEYGYGVGIGAFEGHPKFTHNGAILGYTSVLSYYPAHDLTITVLMNTHSANVWAIDSEVARIVLGLPSPRRPPISLTSEELAPYAGQYLQGSRKVEITSTGDELQWLVQRFQPIGDHVFQGIDDPECTLTFTTDSRGVARAVRSRDGMDTPMQRVR